jgi:hypothetical protein
VVLRLAGDCRFSPDGPPGVCDEVVLLPVRGLMRVPAASAAGKVVLLPVRGLTWLLPGP